MNPNVFVLLANVLLMFAVERFMGVFFEKRRTSFPVFALSYLLFFILTSIERIVFANMGSHMLFVFSATFIITLNYKAPMLKRVAAAVSNYVTFCVIATISAFLMTFVTEPFISYTDEIFVRLQYMAAALFSCLVGFLLRRFKNIRKNNISTPFIWLSALAVPGTLMLGLVFAFFNLRVLTGIIDILIIIGGNLLFIYVYDTLSASYENKLKSTLREQEKDYYFTQCQLMQESVEKVKSLRHDMKIHLAALTDFMADNKAAMEYINSLLGDIAKSEIYSETGNTSIDSIINFKLKNAKENNIKLEIKLVIPPVLNVEVADIITILGNLLDNALEAVEKTEEKLIKIDIEFSKGGLFIKIDNSFDGTVKYTEENQIATLKGKDGHGYGLKNIKQSLEKYNGYMKVNYTEKIFSVGIFLYVDDM